MAKQPKLVGDSMEVFVNDYSFSTQTENIAGGISADAQPTPESPVVPEKLINEYSVQKCKEFGGFGSERTDEEYRNSYSLSLLGRSLR